MLAQHANVRETVVNLYEDNSGKRLVAYVTVNNHQHLALNDAEWISELKKYLKTKLPDHMVPSNFMVMDMLPLLPNGKLDRKALPAPEAQIATSHIAPRTKIEKQLALLWTEVLRRDEPVGIHDNFFEIGGDSILSIQIVAKVKALGLKISSRNLFQYQTIAKLATVVQPLSTTPVVPQILVTGDVPLTPIQKAFFARNLPQPWHYNQFVLLEVETDLNTEHLRQALAALLIHHDTLRLRYHQIESKWQQSYSLPDDKVPFVIEKLCEDSEVEQLLETKAKTYQASLNLEKGPLLRLVLFKFSNHTRLLWCIHHLVIDGVSWRILLEDLHTAYQQLSNGEPVKLPAKTTSFRAWAKRLSDYAQSKTVTNEVAYWQTLLLSDFPALPLDYPDGINTIASTQHYTVSLESAETRIFLEKANNAYNTRINDLLLTALAQILSTWTGEHDCLIDLESHGRIDLFKEVDISRTVGWFTAIFPVHLILPKSDDLGECIEAIKAQLRLVPCDGIGCGLLHYLNSTFDSKPVVPRKKILFNYLGQFDPSPQKAQFCLTEQSFGLSQSHQGNNDYPIEINGLITQERLTFVWSYSGNQYLHTTISRLADNYIQALKALVIHCDRIHQQRTAAPSSLLLPIQPRGKNQPFFCVPGLQGIPRYFYTLAHQLNREQPFYGLYSPEIVGQLNCATVEEQAAHYIAAIKTIQPQGPYQLGGHSFGAVIAFEMAQQLQQAQDEIAFVALFDESAPIDGKENAIEEMDEIEQLVNYVRWLAYFNDIKTDISGESLKILTPDERFESVVKSLNQAGLTLDQREMERTLQAFTNNSRRYVYYVPKGIFSTRVVLFQSQKQKVPELDPQRDDPSWGWQPYATQPIEVHPVPGTHFTMLTMPHVKELATMMSYLFEKD
jgi:non-ribosomal peptide synthase protein (TIGR01720 family)